MMENILIALLHNKFDMCGIYIMRDRIRLVLNQEIWQVKLNPIPSYDLPLRVLHTKHVVGKNSVP